MRDIFGICNFGTKKLNELKSLNEAGIFSRVLYYKVVSSIYIVVRDGFGNAAELCVVVVVLSDHCVAVNYSMIVIWLVSTAIA